MQTHELSSNGRPIVEVAVGVLVQPDLSILLGQRPEGKPYAGYWEFPGGKIEADETVFDALHRELKEEINISINHAHEFLTLEHDYPHAYVRLHICVVNSWEGDPESLEGQGLIWLAKHEVEHIKHSAVEPILPATLPIFEELKKYFEQLPK